MTALEAPNHSFSLEAFRRQAYELGFADVGVAPAVSPRGYAKLLDWLQLGYAADMHYFAKRIEAYRDLSLVLPGTAAVIVLAFLIEVNQPLHRRKPKAAWPLTLGVATIITTCCTGEWSG